MVIYRLSSWLAEQGVWGSNPGLTTTMSEIGFLLLPSHDITDIMLKKGDKSSTQPNLVRVSWSYMYTFTLQYKGRLPRLATPFEYSPSHAAETSFRGVEQQGGIAGECCQLFSHSPRMKIVPTSFKTAQYTCTGLEAIIGKKQSVL